MASLSYLFFVVACRDRSLINDPIRLDKPAVKSGVAKASDLRICGLRSTDSRPRNRAGQPDPARCQSRCDLATAPAESSRDTLRWRAPCACNPALVASPVPKSRWSLRCPVWAACDPSQLSMEEIDEEIHKMRQSRWGVTNVDPIG